MRTAILVSAPVKPGLQEQVRAGLHPQQDFFALADALNATLITPMKPDHRRADGGIGKLSDILVPAWTAFRRAGEFDVIVSDIDRVGLALAVFLKLSRSRTRHVLICHGKIVKPNDIRLIRALKLQSHIHRFVCYGPLVARQLKSLLGLPDARVAMINHPADHRFWHPLPVPVEPVIASAGLLRRDYGLLAEAVRGLDVSVVVAAASPWVSSQKPAIGSHAVPPNMRFTRLAYQELRDLYARSLFVAIPLQPSHAQSGSLVMYEAMAMGKAVVATRTDGQAALELIREGETGYYLAPGDTGQWRSTIQYLLAHQAEAAGMGRRNRAIVEGGLNMDAYVRDMMAVVQSLAVEEKSPQLIKNPARR